MKNKSKKLKTFILLILSANFLYSTTIAYDFRIWQKVRNLNDSTKIKADIVIKKKINTSVLIKKYLTALKKINVNALSEWKQALYYYLLSKLDPNFVLTKVDNSNVNNSNSNTLNNTVYNSWTSTSSSSASSNTSSTNTINSPVDNNSTTGISSTTTTDSSSSYTTSSQIPIFTPITIPTWTTAISTSRLITYTNLSTVIKNYIDSLKSKTKSYAELNDNYEFEEYSKKYKVKFSEYYIIDFSNPVSSYLWISWLSNEILFKKWDNFILTKWGFTIEQKLSLSDINSKVKYSANSSDSVLFNISSWYYYAYSLYDYKYFEIPVDWIYLSQFSNLSWLENTLLIYKNWKYLLITDFSQYKLFALDNLKSTNNPLVFLKSLGKDLYFYKSSDYESMIELIKTKAIEITSSDTNDSQKISSIYSWLTKNLSYDSYSTEFIKWNISEKTYFDTVNNEVFTWIWTFKNRSWVCDWFTKLAQYMLIFAWIQNVEIETWKADVWWTLISHAWLKIWDLYYDPTWDIYSDWIPTNYKWFALPKDDMYKTHFIQN